MGLGTLVILALGLSMDAFAVSVSDGMIYCDLKRRQILLIGLMFGLFQGIMPLIGYFAGSTFSGAIKAWDHWIAFFLLAVIGGKMILEALRDGNAIPEAAESEKIFSFKMLILQAVATSIDALAVGVSFALIEINQYFASLFIACITFICSLAGVLIGRRFGGRFRQKAEILGGVMLIGIGVKILVEHLID